MTLMSFVRMIMICLRMIKGDKMEWLTYSRECGFNIVEADNEELAEDVDTIVLDSIEEVDEQIVKRIRKLIKDE